MTTKLAAGKLAVKLSLAMMLLLTMNFAAQARDGDVTVTTRLTGAAINGLVPKGKADLRRRDDGSRKLEIEVEDVNLPAGTRFNVLVDNRKVGEIVLNEFRAGEVELNTNDNQIVPPIISGTTIVVQKTDGTTLVAGAFSNVTNPPPPAGSELRTRATLVGAAINRVLPKGKADYREKVDGQRKLEVEVEDVNLPAGTILNVLVDNTRVGTITLNGFFGGEVEFETERGQTVPRIVIGTTTVTVTNQAGATILSGGFATNRPAANPIDDSEFFVRQQYVDFLERGPEVSGFDAWVAVLNRCSGGQQGSDPACDRVEVSSGFFRSSEFAARGYWAFRFYGAALGRLPKYVEFVPDMRGLSGFQTEAEAEANRNAFLNTFTQTPEFRSIYDDVSTSDRAAEFIDRLENRGGVRLADDARRTLVEDMRSGRHTAAQTLRAFIETQTVSDKFFYRGFVAMQYFGYLRRDPEAEGYNAWVEVMTNGKGEIRAGDYRTMINGFVNSIEYRNRF